MSSDPTGTAPTRADAVQVTASDVRRWIFASRESDDKYRRGVVALWTGSTKYPGAARLGVEAAARAGAGMVRYVGPDAVGQSVLRLRPETVLGDGRADAHVAGSGIPSLVPGGAPVDDEGRSRAARVIELLRSGECVVLDAGGLDLVGAPGVPDRLPNALLTPHARELARLAKRVLTADSPVAAGPVGGAHAADDLAAVLARDEGEIADEVLARPADWAAAVARATGASVLLKGATTIVVAPDGGRPLVVSSPTSVLATAGTGDVLAGSVGALAAIASKRAPDDRPSLVELGAAAAWLNGRAALLASLRAVDPATSGAVAVAEPPTATSAAPVTALEVAAALPAVIGALLDDEPGAGAEAGAESGAGAGIDAGAAAGAGVDERSGAGAE